MTATPIDRLTDPRYRLLDDAQELAGHLARTTAGMHEVINDPNVPTDADRLRVVDTLAAAADGIAYQLLGVLDQLAETP